MQVWQGKYEILANAEMCTNVPFLESFLAWKREVCLLEAGSLAGVKGQYLIAIIGAGPLSVFAALEYWSLKEEGGGQALGWRARIFFSLDER